MGSRGKEWGAEGKEDRYLKQTTDYKCLIHKGDKMGHNYDKCVTSMYVITGNYPFSLVHPLVPCLEKLLNNGVGRLEESAVGEEKVHVVVVVHALLQEVV